MKHPREILEHYWGYQSFREGQEEIINAVLNNEDTFALLPTGGGKSVCYQVPALAREGICIVISPLIALMKEQVNGLKSKGIKAMAITSEYSKHDIDTMLDNCLHADYKFLFLSPERLQNELVQQRIKQMEVNLIAVDEAHCISEWGNDFRPAYRNISILRDLQPATNVLALTATARSEVVKDVIEQLDMIDPVIVKLSFERSNIELNVIRKEDKHHSLLSFLDNNEGAGIIYLRSRRGCIQLADFLTNNGKEALIYHGGLSNDIKTKNYNYWKNSDRAIMIATNAFGMGIDKPDVRFVVHFNLPDSLESYYQEAGRAGRDGEMARATIITNDSDIGRVKRQFLDVLPTIDAVKTVYKKLNSYFQIPYGELVEEVFEFNFGSFCQTYELNSSLTFNCLQLLDNLGVISLSKEFRNYPEIQFLVSSEEVLNYLRTNTGSGIIVKTILRTYGGVFDHPTRINPSLVSKKSSSSESEIMAVLRRLESQELISLKAMKTDAQIVFLQPREDEKTINRISSLIKSQHQTKTEQVNAVLDYLNIKACRQRFLLNYFGEKDGENCNLCDNCRPSGQKLNRKLLMERVEILKKLLEEKPRSSRELMEQTEIDEEVLILLIKTMLEKDIISLTDVNTYKLN